MVTAFSIGDDVNTIIMSKITAIDIRTNMDGTPSVKYGITITYTNGHCDYQWITEEDLLKLINEEENEDESKT